MKVTNCKSATSVYNHLNLPTEISFGSLGTIEYLYTATGTKLQKKVTEGDGMNITDYRGGFQYTNNALDHFSTAEGYVKATSNASAGGGNTTVYNYVFNYTDHLGNIRLRYTKDPQTGALTILEEDHYYPFGLKHRGYNAKHEVFEVSLPNTITLTPVTPLTGDTYKYKFGGKELQSELGLEMYDFGARNYDPALGRWMNVDPLAELMRRHSPYNYAFDNPVYFTDPDGMMPGVGGFANVDSNTSTGSFETSGGFDVNTVDKKGNILETQYHADVNDAGNAASEISSSIRDSGGGGVSLTNKRDTAGTGLAMGVDGVVSVGTSDDHPFSATVVIDKSVPSDLFSDISVITEDKEAGKNRTDPPTAHGSINGVDGVFLKNQPESKSWFKISDFSEATIYYNSQTGKFDIQDTTGSLHPVRWHSSYYVDWVDKNDSKSQPPAKNPFKRD